VAIDIGDFQWQPRDIVNQRPPGASVHVRQVVARVTVDGDADRLDPCAMRLPPAQQTPALAVVLAFVRPLIAIVRAFSRSALRQASSVSAEVTTPARFQLR